MWALGIMMYLLFSGKKVMMRNEQKDTMDAIINHQVLFVDPCWKSISMEAK
jgi:hypothetical protein